MSFYQQLVWMDIPFCIDGKPLDHVKEIFRFFFFFVLNGFVVNDFCDGLVYKFIFKNVSFKYNSKEVITSEPILKSLYCSILKNPSRQLRGVELLPTDHIYLYTLELTIYTSRCPFASEFHLNLTLKSDKIWMTIKARI